MKILVANDLSARSDRAMLRSVKLVREHGAELEVLHVVDADMPRDLRDHALNWGQRMLADAAGKLLEGGSVPLRINVICADPDVAITETAERGAADLLVIGVHPGTRGDRKSFAETTAGHILKSGHTPMLLVRNEVLGPYRNVVVGVDFSKFSRLALRQAVMIAPQARTHLVHGYHVPFKGRLGTAAFVSEVAYFQRLQIDAFLAEEMNNLESRAASYGLLPGSLTTTLEEGAPMQVLRTAQKRLEADLLVIATHGRGTLSRAIWGSVATDILNDPPCDVLVIRPF